LTPEQLEFIQNYLAQFQGQLDNKKAQEWNN
jgi:hypothetical protein